LGGYRRRHVLRPSSKDDGHELGSVRGTYSDSRGRDVIEFLNDSETLRVTIRGVAFGPNLAPARPVAPAQLLGFLVSGSTTGSVQ
jgi:hypothetical protein